jgi:hypothetical protein
MASTPRKRNNKAEYQARQARALAKGESYNIARPDKAVLRTPTVKTMKGFQTAYSVFNRDLFGGELGECMITLRTFGKARGYFSPDRFVNLGEVITAHEIALDPRQFMDRTAVEILSTLAHEMCHVWQQEFGSPSRNGYHNAEWATKMCEIGLAPSNTGEPGGKTTGQQMSHYIVEGGRFEKKATRLVALKYFTAEWSDIEGFLMAPATPVPAAVQMALGGSLRAPRVKTGVRTKYVCMHCSNAAWARPGLLLSCAGDAEAEHPVMAML